MLIIRGWQNCSRCIGCLNNRRSSIIKSKVALPKSGHDSQARVFENPHLICLPLARKVRGRKSRVASVTCHSLAAHLCKHLQGFLTKFEESSSFDLNGGLMRGQKYFCPDRLNILTLVQSCSCYYFK